MSDARTSNAVTGHNCATHGQNMPDACICRGARYWMDRALAAEKRLAKYERRYPSGADMTTNYAARSVMTTGSPSERNLPLPPEKRFHISDVLSAYSGFLVSTRHMTGVYDVLNFLTGDNLYTHQLGRAMEECHGWLERQHPMLKEIDCSGLTPETLPAWVKRTVERYGETLLLTPLPPDGHEFREPLEELESMVGSDRIVKVSI